MVIHKLLWCGSLPWDAVLQEQTTLVRHRVIGPASVGTSLHRGTGPARILLQHRLPVGSQPPWGIHQFCRVDVCSTTDLHVLQGHSSLTMVFTTGCRGTSALMPGALDPAPSSVTLLFAELLLSPILTPLFPGYCFHAITSFSFLNMLPQMHYAVIERLSPGRGMSSLGPTWGQLGANWNCLSWMQGKLLAASQKKKPHTCGCPTTKTLS